MLREKIALAMMKKLMEKTLPALRRSAIKIETSEELSDKPGASRLGGIPDVPADFQWPYFTTDTYDDDTVKPRPLTFLAQFNCEELTALDPEHPLPKKGVLSFFYELGSQRWGFSPEDAGCARVYWFEDAGSLRPAEYPEDLEEEYRLSARGVKFSEEISYPGCEDVMEMQSRHIPELYDIYEETAEKLGIDMDDPYSKLLGWPDIIQNSMAEQCELVSQGYYMGGSNPPEGLSCPPEPRTAEEQTQYRLAGRQALQTWRLLFQMSEDIADELDLMFGDCGSIYFYIREEDLQARNFDRVWLILQCG